MMLTPHSQRGSIILYAMLIMSAMLAIGLTLNGLFIRKLRAAGVARDSVAALAAADSAAEMCLYEARHGIDLAAMTFENEATFSVADLATGTDITADCSTVSSASFGFRATGTYHGVRRTLEVSQ